MLYYELDHFFNVKKYLGVANMFYSTEKLNCIGVDLYDLVNLTSPKTIRDDH
jgi:hypothetical protein